MQRALLEMVVLSVLAGVVSVHVLLHRLAFVGDAMTHAVFPGIALAFVTDRSLLLGATFFGVLAAVLLTFATRLPHLGTDAALGVIVGAFFSVGVLIVSTSHTFTADLSSLLFGRILAVDGTQVAQTAAVAVVVVAALAMVHKELVLRAFDPIGSAALGYRPVVIDLVLNVAVALMVVASVRAVGTVLVLAIIVVPAAAARLLTDRIAPMMVIAVALTALASYAGLALSYEASLRHEVRLGAGATIVVLLCLAFVLSAGLGAWLRRRHGRAVASAEAS